MDDERRGAAWMTIAVLLLCQLVAACGGAFPSLASADRDRFDRCRSSIRPVVCRGERDDSLVCVGRERDAANEYAVAADKAGWLVGHGCPEAVASYGTSAADGSAARAVRMASAAYDCPEASIIVQTASPTGTWLVVCGWQRLYVEANGSLAEDLARAIPIE